MGQQVNATFFFLFSRLQCNLLCTFFAHIQFERKTDRNDRLTINGIYK